MLAAGCGSPDPTDGTDSGNASAGAVFPGAGGGGGAAGAEYGGGSGGAPLGSGSTGGASVAGAGVHDAGGVSPGGRGGVATTGGAAGTAGEAVGGAPVVDEPPLDPPASGCSRTGVLPPSSDWRFDVRGPGDRSAYYFTRGAVEVFKTDDPNGGAIERSEKASYFWTGSSGWSEFCANYAGGRGGGSILQVNIRGEAVPVLMISRSDSGLKIAHGKEVKGKTLATPPTFSLYVRNNAITTEVFVNGSQWVKFDDARPGFHYFKYGLYHGKNAFQDLPSGAELEVADVSLTLKAPIKNP